MALPASSRATTSKSSGLHNVTRAQVMEVMGGDIGRNIFFVPLAERKAQLEQIPWVESASVMRFVPNRLQIEIHERTPVAFARVGSKILLIDAGGTLMELPGAGKKKYSFPVILGMNPGEPLSTRAARMKIYNDVISQLDSGGAHYSQELSEVDLSDPDDVKVLANNPRAKCSSIWDLRTISTATRSTSPTCRSGVSSSTSWSPWTCATTARSSSIRIMQGREAAATFHRSRRKAMAAGVKPAALITHIPSGPGQLLALAAKDSLGRPTAKPAQQKPVAKAHHRRTPTKAAHRKPASSSARTCGQSNAGNKPEACTCSQSHRSTAGDISCAGKISATQDQETKSRQLPKGRNQPIGMGEPARKPSDGN